MYVRMLACTYVLIHVSMYLYNVHMHAGIYIPDEEHINISQETILSYEIENIVFSRYFDVW